MRSSVALLALIAIAGCGDDSASSDGGSDLSASKDFSASVDAKLGIDLAGVDFGGVSCGSMICSGANDVCCLVPDIANKTVSQMCVAAGSCGDGGIPATCDGPEDCPSGACCVDLTLGGSNNITGSAACTSTCAASVMEAGGGGALTTKLCHGPSDCASYNGSTPFGDQPYTSCCSYPGIAFNFCAPSLITTALSGVTCM